MHINSECRQKKIGDSVLITTIFTRNGTNSIACTSTNDTVYILHVCSLRHTETLLDPTSHISCWHRAKIKEASKSLSTSLWPDTMWRLLWNLAWTMDNSLRFLPNVAYYSHKRFLQSEVEMEFKYTSHCYLYIILSAHTCNSQRHLGRSAFTKDMGSTTVGTIRSLGAVYITLFIPETVSIVKGKRKHDITAHQSEFNTNYAFNIQTNAELHE